VIRGPRPGQGRPLCETKRRALAISALVALAALILANSPTGSALAGEGTGAWEPAAGVNPPGETMFGGKGPAVVLNNGKIFRQVINGGSGQDFAEIYDPALGAGVWKRVDQPSGVPGSYPNTHSPQNLVTISTGEVVIEASTFNNVSPSPQWERFNPRGPVWNAMAQPTFLRNLGPTIVLLKPPNCGDKCGFVLAAGGGRDDLKAPEPAERLSAELYDPSNNRWLPTGPPSAPIVDSSGLGLEDGRVLVVGVSSGAGDAHASQLYDPSSGTWAPAGRMAEARLDYYTSLAQIRGPLCADKCGKVLAVGAYGDLLSSSLGESSKAELFSPARSAWEGIPSPNFPSGGHTATSLPNGQVLYVHTSENGGSAADLYDPRDGSFKEIATNALLPGPRRNHSATLLLGKLSECGFNCGKVLLTGGDDSSGQKLDSAELYTPAPAIAKLVPDHGPATGGFTVQVTGAGMATVAGAQGLSFEGQPMAAVPDSDNPDAKLSFVAPPHAPGVVPTRVANSGGNDSADFTYDPVPVPSPLPTTVPSPPAIPPAPGAAPGAPVAVPKPVVPPPPAGSVPVQPGPGNVAGAGVGGGSGPPPIFGGPATSAFPTSVSSSALIGASASTAGAPVSAGVAAALPTATLDPEPAPRFSMVAIKRSPLEQIPLEVAFPAFGVLAGACLFTARCRNGLDLRGDSECRPAFKIA